MYGDGSQVREFTHVSDVVAANLLAADADVAPGTVVNISGGSEIALTDLIDLVGQLGGQPVSLEQRPPEPGDVQRNGGSTELARRILGWVPAMPLDGGIRSQLDWIRGSSVAASDRPLR